MDRPREKLARVGAEALGDNELVALVLGAGTRSRGALTGGARRDRRPPTACRGWCGSGSTNCDRVPGVGASRAARVLAAVELGRRTLIRRSRRTAADAVDGGCGRLPAAAVLRVSASSGSA